MKDWCLEREEVMSLYDKLRTKFPHAHTFFAEIVSSYSYHIDITEDLRKISNKEEDTTKPDRGDEMLIDLAPGARDRNVD